MSHNPRALERLDDDKLIDVIKNHRKYGYSHDFRAKAISTLALRGFSEEEIKLIRAQKNHSYDRALELYELFNKDSRTAFFLYIAMFLTNLASLFIVDSQFLEKLVFGLIWIIFLLYVLFLIKSFLSQSQFYDLIGNKYGVQGALIYLILGMPFYFFVYFYLKKQMKEKLSFVH